MQRTAINHTLGAVTPIAASWPGHRCVSAEWSADRPGLTLTPQQPEGGVAKCEISGGRPLNEYLVTVLGVSDEGVPLKDEFFVRTGKNPGAANPVQPPQRADIYVA